MACHVVSSQGVMHERAARFMMLRCASNTAGGELEGGVKRRRKL